MASQEGSLAIHTILSDRYSIERVIGEGGFGITYEARHIQMGTHVAIKEFFIAGKCVRQADGQTVAFQGIKPELFEKYRKRFHDEARTLFKLNNPHVVHVHDIFDANGTTYIVMDFVTGRTLQEIVDERGPLPYEEAVNYIAQLCEAVEHIHANHILHRDIKPENIIITPQSNVVLIDFGSARSFVHDQEQRHTAMITMGYAPIEQYTSTSKKGNYTDVYAVGGTFYFILTGRKPEAATDRVLNDELVPPREINPKISESANYTIMKALKVKPELRYQNVSDLMSDLLGGVTESLDEPSISAEVTPVPVSNKKPKMLVWILVAAVVIIGVGVAIGFSLSHKEVPDNVGVEYAAKYNGICSKCDEHLRMVNDDRFFLNFIEIARDLREMQTYEAQQPFTDFGLEPQSGTYMNQYCEKIAETKAVLLEKQKEQREVFDSPDNIALADINRKLEMLDKLLEQARTGDASNIILPEEMRKE
ncbi:MAG: serine/threonine protein kinase [Paludibacteraceae bacterium]|nr:serine/threonine protein kinase [Paludibacteraceae bacterium]